MDAVISDIRGNLEALDAVLDAIRRLGVKRILCLGDLVGYGPDAPECIRRSASWDAVVAGEWDLAMIDYDPTEWNPTTVEHLEWVRGQVRAASDAPALLDILDSYRPAFVENQGLFAHGTPRDVREWVFPEDVYQPKKLNRIGKLFDTVCICGHSHLQGLIRGDEQSGWKFIQPVPEERYELRTGQKTIVTAGSVGQPRDGDPRAGFLTIDDGSVTFHRIAYNFAATVDKIRSIPQIDDMHGERLLVGR